MPNSDSAGKPAKPVIWPAFEKAKVCVMCFGKYKGLTLEQIGASRNGLRYLDWLLGEREKDKNNTSYLDKCLIVFMQDESVQRDLSREIP